MPYFIYKIHPGRRLERVTAHAAFRDASQQARAMRRELAGVEPCTVKIIFAADPAAAEALLAEEREPIPNPEDD